MQNNEKKKRKFGTLTTSFGEQLNGERGRTEDDRGGVWTTRTHPTRNPYTPHT